MAHNSQTRRNENSTRDATSSKGHPGSLTRINKPSQDHSGLSTSGEERYRQSPILANAITTQPGFEDRLQLFQIQQDYLQVQPVLEAHPKHDRLGQAPRAAAILRRQLSSSASPTDYPVYQRTNPSDLAQAAPTVGQTPLYAGTAPTYPVAAPPYSGAVPAHSGAAGVNPVQQPSAAGAATPSSTAANNPAAEQPPPANSLPSGPPPSSPPPPAPPHSPEPHQQPPQVNQPVPDSPAPSVNTASAASSATSSAAPSAATAATLPPSGDDYQPNPSPVVHHPFNLSNSSIVVSVPTHVPSANSPPLSGNLSNQTEHHAHHKSSTSLGATTIIIAVALPIALLILGGAMMVAYRIMKSKRRAHGGNRTSGGSQLIDPEGAQHQMENMAEKKRFSSYLKFPYAMMDDNLSNFAVRAESGFAPPLPPVILPSPQRPSTSLRAEAHDSHTSDPANTTNESFKGGVACKMNCLVTRTFSPTMPDELRIEIGDRVLVYMLFDDGWCLGENLNFEKHEGGDGISRTGVLPQDCLSGLQRASVAATSDGAPSFRTAGEEQQEYPISPGPVPPVPPKANSQEILAVGASNEKIDGPEPLYKPERNSSLLCDREAQLFLELDNALSFNV
ncbi:hypothetical protein PTTG_05575 [Puccinia triticina 1-1 BBBD Race 1]|uniref:SH3 domain-containing protein n=1 Tax=Puccinia triticina (isolate 1-1 / race 1 (BBBD)) TaxID=630390 RepID=A0A180GKU3_PUCT1|nr:hypothetical protein PTTG_05575 [Puccinia triticina 1-1 BBBD Race 1]